MDEDNNKPQTEPTPSPEEASIGTGGEDQVVPAKKSHNGLKQALPYLLLVILLAAFAWFIFWQAGEAENDLSSANDALEVASTEPVQSTINKNEMDSESQIVVEECSQQESDSIPISYVIPTSWKVVDGDGCYKRDGVINWTYVYQTSNYKDSNVGYGGTTKGAIIGVSVSNIRDMQSAYYNPEKVLNGTVETKSMITEARQVTVGEYKGVEFIARYEGPGAMITIFDNDGYQYSFDIEEDIDGPGFNSYLDEYRQVVNSFKVIN